MARRTVNHDPRPVVPARGVLRAWHAAGGYLRAAPGTFIWLAILLATTVVASRVPPPVARDILRWHSTNLHQLAVSPVRVLVTSALWIDDGDWWGYLLAYNVFHVPAERWLGTRRWLTVVLISHIGATLVSQGVLAFAIGHGHAPPAAAHALDYGVSYGLLGVITVLTYRIASPWRYPYAALVILVCAGGVVAQRDVTSIGHLAAALLGLACYPLTRAHPARWDPRPAARTAWHQARTLRNR